MKRLLKAVFILALILCFAIPAFAIKILPYNVPLQDLMRWDKYGATLKLSNPEGETLTVAWATTVDLWNYDGSTWTYDLPSGDTFAFGKGVAITGVSSITGAVTITGDVGITGDILMATTSKIQFHDTGLYINASGNGALVISSDGTLVVGATTSYTLTSPAVKFIAITSVVHEYDAASYVTQTVDNAGVVLVSVTGDTTGTYEIATDDGAITLDSASTILLESTTGITATGDISASNAAGPQFVDEAATTTNPTLCPDKAEDDTGIGWASDTIHIVLGGIDEYNFSASALTLASGNNLVITQGTIDLSNAATGNAAILLNDNVADALSITRNSTDMMVFDTTTPRITITPATTIVGDLTLSGNVGMADDKIFTLGTTTTNAETKITIEFEETTSGIGFIKIGDLTNAQVLNLNPGATIVPLSVNVTHSAATGDCDDYVGVYTKFTISGDGDTGLTGVPLAARLYVNAPISQAYAFQNKAWKQNTDDITAMAVSSVSLMIENAFEATQTLNVAEFFLDSDEARTVTCTSENFNMVLIKNNGNIAGLNSLLKLVSAGTDSPGSIIHVEGATDNGFIQFDTGSDCVADTGDPGAAGGGGTAAATHKIKCRFDGVTFYLAGWADF